MKKKLIISSIMLYIVSIITVLFGLVYLFTPKLMPYHEKFLGIPQENLDPSMLKLFLFFLKGAGAAFLSLGITLFVLVKGPFGRGDVWARRIIPVMTLVALIPLLFITIKIGLYTPWWIIFLMILLVICSMYISKKK